MTLVIEHDYHHRGAVTDLFRDRSPEILLSGPAGTGKSRGCLEKLYVAACKYPGMRGLMVRKTAVSLTTTALVTWSKQVAVDSIKAKHVVYYGGSSQEPAGYRFNNGSFIGVGGMDKPTKIMSSEYDMVYVQEAIELTEEDWESITTRLRNDVMPYQQIIADTNPSTPTHWLRQRVNRGATRLLDSKWADNPVIYPQPGVLSEPGREYLSKLANLTGVRKARLHGGLWVAAEGIIYEDWDESIHIVDRKDVMAKGWSEWPRYWSIDFGYTNPFVCQRWAIDPDGRAILYGETYQTKTLVEDHAAELKRILEHEPRPRVVVCDHDAEDRATFERHTGLSTTAANKTVSEGLQAVAGRLRPAGDGQPRLMFMRDAVKRRDQSLLDARKPASTVEEIPGYVWEQPRRDDQQSKDQPHKQDDHGCDAMRYLVAELDLGARPKLRFIGQAY